MLPTKDQWATWKANPVSAWFFAGLQQELQKLTEDFIMGGTVNTDSVDSTALNTAVRHAETKTLYMVGHAHYEDMCEMLNIQLPEEIDEED